jgi:NADH:ubiquinone oxidoreductase, NADH-binding (51 kD) subunit
MCSHEGLVDVIMPGYSRVTYAKVKPDIVPQIMEEHVGKGNVVMKYALSQMCLNGQDTKQYKDLPSFDGLEQNKNQMKLVTRNCGMINPEDIDEYIMQGGYKALEKILSDMTPQDVINEVGRSRSKGPWRRWF